MPKGCGNGLGKLWGCRFHYICLSFLCPLHLFFSIFHAGLLWVILLGLGVHTAFSYLFIQAVFFSLTCISSFFLCCGNLFCWVPFSLYPLFSQFSILPPVSGYGDCHAFSSPCQAFSSPSYKDFLFNSLSVKSPCPQISFLYYSFTSVIFCISLFFADSGWSPFWQFITC